MTDTTGERKQRWQRSPSGSNWGEFGVDDQVGRINLITPEHRQRAIREVHYGLPFCLSLPLDYPGGTVVSSVRRPPELFASRNSDGAEFYNAPVGMDTERPCGVACDDGVILHTQYSTHWDSLAHWGTLFDANGDGREEIVYYNGYRGGEHVLSPVGQMPPQALALGIEKLAETCVQGRAVLISLADAFGPDRTHVDYDMLVATMATQHAEVGPGDFLLLHSGFDDALLAMQREPSERVLSRTGALLDGRDDRLRSWIRESGVVAICSDTATIEAPYPDSETGGRTMLPLHELCLFELGIFLGELWRLGDLARWLRAHGRSACLLTAPPLRLPGATGSPVTPVALV